MTYVRCAKVELIRRPCLLALNASTKWAIRHMYSHLDKVHTLGVM